MQFYPVNITTLAYLYTQMSLGLIIKKSLKYEGESPIFFYRGIPKCAQMEGGKSILT